MYFNLPKIIFEVQVNKSILITLIACWELTQVISIYKLIKGSMSYLTDGKNDVCSQKVYPIYSVSHKGPAYFVVQFFLGLNFFQSSKYLSVFFISYLKKGFILGGVVEKLGNSFPIFHLLPHPPTNFYLPPLLTTLSPPFLTIWRCIRLAHIFFFWI